MSREVIPEVTLLQDGRGERPEDAAGAGGFWYETGIWSLPLSPTARVLYAGLCSYLGPGEINRQDLRSILKGSSDEDIRQALEELANCGLLAPYPGGYVVRSVSEYEG